MIEDTFVRDRALQSANIEIRLLPELISAIWTPAKEHLVAVDHERDCVRRMLFCQTGRADDQILRFGKALLRIGRKHVDATLATKVILKAVVVTGCRFVSMDSQPDQ